MNKRSFSWALALLCAATLSAQAQESAAASTSAAKTSSAKKGDPLGLGGGKSRPKNAKTEITCKDQATFDNTSGIATFVTTVFVKDPQFNLYCDRLTVYLNKERKGIEHAEADGHVVVVQENTDDDGKAKKSIGRSGHAVFYPATGQAILTNWPQLQQDINNHLSTEQTTIMTLNRDGHLKTDGPSRTVIIDAGDTSSSSAASSPASSSTSTSAPAQ